MKHLQDFNQFEALSGHIDLLNVRDGDAILLTLRRANKTFLAVIDGGDSMQEQKVLRGVQVKCQALGKNAPDLLVCTHYDSDHIAGLLALVEHYGNNIGKLWMHRPPPLIETEEQAIREVLEKSPGSPLLNESARAIRMVELTKHGTIVSFRNVLLESLTQAHDLLELAARKGIAIEAPFPGECTVQDWPEISILGPTRSFYRSLFPQQTTIAEFLASEMECYLVEARASRPTTGANPCDLLQTNPGTSVINQASVIICIDAAPGKLLLTGDAGVVSFKAVANYPDSITKAAFLKIPHHGSSYNISRELIELINPKAAYNSGDRYESAEVMGCLRSKAGRDVRTTKAGTDLLYRF